VTAVVFTTSVELVVPVGMSTLPAEAEPQTAGEADEEQFVAVENPGLIVSVIVPEELV
jgi:hypothetical protein